MNNNKSIALYIDDGRKETNDLREFLRMLKDQNYNPLIIINNLGTFISDFPTVCSDALWDFRGPIIADAFIAARFLLEYPTHFPKYFWVREADWTNPNFDAIDQIKVHQSMEITKIFSNKEFMDTYNKVWGMQNCKIMQDFINGETF